MILITGVCGFIGFHLANKLNEKVIGIDTLDTYYDVKLKKDRLKILKKKKNFKFIKTDIKDFLSLKNIFKKNKIKIVINLAAQPGVRISFENPYKTLSENVFGFINILEISRQFNIKNFIYASSSSVYGDTKVFPFSENDKTNFPISVYGVSKLTNEIIAQSYSKNYNMNCFGLRFFTVYGAYGRPDMAYFKFLDYLKKNKKIKIYNNGNMLRDFTYIDDIIDAILKILKIKKNLNKNTILNIGKGSPDQLMNLIKFLEINYKKKFKKNFTINVPNGDIKKTYANTTKIKKLLKWKPQTKLSYGIKKFVDWYKIYYKLN